MFHTILLVGVCLPLATASVYPTQPVQATVWRSDEPMYVSWVEDGRYPLLSELGPLEISLWNDQDTYLVPLASGVDPTAKQRQVTVPGPALRGSKFTVRFTTNKPLDVMIYSADFVISPGNATMAATATQSGSAAGNGTAGSASAGMTSGSGTNARTAGSTSVTVMATTTASTSARFRPTPSGPPQGTAGRAANAARRGVDVEKLKFRFVFVIWPVLMGITMAL